MISPPARNFLNSSFVNVDSLRATEGEPHLDIHPADAAARCGHAHVTTSISSERISPIVSSVAG